MSGAKSVSYQNDRQETIGGVRDLSPIERLVNLRTLVIQDSKVEDDSFIAKLPHLEELTVSWSYVRCVGPYVAHPNLRRLRIVYPGLLSKTTRSRLNQAFDEDPGTGERVRRIDPLRKMPVIGDGQCP